MPTPGIYYQDLHNDPNNPRIPPPLPARDTSHAASLMNQNRANNVNSMNAGYGSHDINANTGQTAYGSSNFGSGYSTQPSAVDGVLDGPYQPGLAKSIDAAPTYSHELATQQRPVGGLVDQPMNTGPGEIKDLGWNEPKQMIASPLVGGLQNEDLWILIRRFNKVSVSEHRSCLCP